MQPEKGALTRPLRAGGSCPPPAPPPAPPPGAGKYGGVVMQYNASLKKLLDVPFTIQGDTMTISCTESADATEVVVVNADEATCFLYSAGGLPAPPLSLPCK